jgi:hypothetical protein
MKAQTNDEIRGHPRDDCEKDRRGIDLRIPG